MNPGSTFDGWRTKGTTPSENARLIRVQEAFLDKMSTERCTVLAYLKSGIALHGVIEFYDTFVIMLRGSTSEVIYKSAISTIRPSDWTKNQNVQEALTA